jgi:hypothetical protein
MTEAVQLFVLIVPIALVGWVALWRLLFAANARREQRAEERFHQHLNRTVRAVAEGRKRAVAHIREALRK